MDVLRELMRVNEKLEQLQKGVDEMGVECLFVTGDFVRLLSVKTTQPPTINQKVWISVNDSLIYYKVSHVERTFSNCEKSSQSLLVTVFEVKDET